MNREDKVKMSGFTIIELLLAMTFVTILLLAIALTVIQLSKTYNKGLTLRAVDQASRVITSDIRKVISQSQPFVPDTALIEQSDQGIIYGGRLCTGSFSYIWNYGKALSDSYRNTKNTYISEDGSPIAFPEIRFVRVRDSGSQYCADPSMQVLKKDAIELLSAGDNNLAIQSFAVARLANDLTVGQSLYRIIMEIGTNDKDALDQLQTIDTTCKPPSDDMSLQEFCAVNKFDFTAKAGNQGGQ